MNMEKRTPNAIERLTDELRERLPGVDLELDPAETSTGGWFLDARLDGHHVAIEWRPRGGFGITSSAMLGYGEGADETVSETDEHAAFARVVELLTTRARTVPTRTLVELRNEAGLKQAELADRLGIGQSAYSQMERRGDYRLSTVISIVAALGGRLEMRAVFPNGETRELVFRKSNADRDDKDSVETVSALDSTRVHG